MPEFVLSRSRSCRRSCWQHAARRRLRMLLPALWGDQRNKDSTCVHGYFFFSSRRRHTRFKCDWSSDVCSSDLAQAHGIAARVRHLATIPNASRTWPEKLLDELGRLALLTHAYRRSEQLDTLLQEDVRQMIGWTLSQEEVGARGEIVSDDWLILGQTLDEEERVRVQRTWLLGIRSQRH